MQAYFPNGFAEAKGGGEETWNPLDKLRGIKHVISGKKNVFITQRMAKNVIPLIYSPWIENGKKTYDRPATDFSSSSDFLCFLPFLASQRPLAFNSKNILGKELCSF